jgi:hypothetical protein
MLYADSGQGALIKEHYKAERHDGETPYPAARKP